MKVNFNAINQGSSPAKNSGLLSLIPEAKVPLNKSNSVELMLATDPANMATSAKYKMLQLILREGVDVRAVLTWKRDMVKIFAGLDLDTWVKRHKMVENLLADTANALYVTHITTLATARRLAASVRAETAHAGDGGAILVEALDTHTDVVDVDDAIEFMITELLPRRILARIKRFLRRECRKPADVKVKIYLQLHYTGFRVS